MRFTIQGCMDQSVSYRICNKCITTGATSGAETDNLSRAPEFTPDI